MQEQHQIQQHMLLDLLEKQRAAHKKELAAWKQAREEVKDSSHSKAKLPKPTLQKLGERDDVEHFGDLRKNNYTTRLAKRDIGYPARIIGRESYGCLM